MYKFMQRLTNSVANTHTSNLFLPSGFLWGLILVALVGYSLPWLVNPGASLTFGGYDLAEWASLHPEVRATPILITSLLLRIQLALVALLVAFNIPYPSRTLGTGVGLVFVISIIVGLLPPLEYFSVSSGDGNYQQQFGIAIITFVLVLIAISGLLTQHRKLVTLIIALAGIITGGIGLTQGYTLMQQFLLPVHIGPGGLLLMGVYGVFILVPIRTYTLNKKVAHTGDHPL
jgi:hypothetical protein